MEDLEVRILAVFKEQPTKAFTNTDLCLLLNVAERKMRRTTQALAEAAKISVSGRKGSSNLYQLPPKLLYAHQKSYNEGYEAGLKASNLEAFTEGKRSAIRSIARKIGVSIHV
jgi:hypothetical protein